MFRKTVSAVLGATMLAGFALVTAPAGAASRAWETTSRGWEISVHNDATCSAYRKYEDGRRSTEPVVVIAATCLRDRAYIKQRWGY